MARVSLRTLGGLQIHVDGKAVGDLGARKACALLVYLAVESEHVHQRAHLAGLLWPDWPESTARTYLRQSIAMLRDALADRASSQSLLLATRQTVQINPRSDFWLDVGEVTSGLAGATGTRRRALTPELARQYSEAVDLYGGGFLEGFYLDGCDEFSEWQLLTAEHLRRQVVETLDRLAMWHREAGSIRPALSCAQRRVEIDPLSEEGQRRCMRLLAEAGELSAALTQYDRYRTLVRDSLRSEPAPATVELAERIRRGEIEDAGPGPRPIATEEVPAFLREGMGRPAQPFVSRERELEALSNHLANVVAEGQGRIVFVTGAAGQGKTALMQEFARRATAQRDDLLTAFGQNASLGGAGDPLSPFRQVLAQLMGDLRPSWAAGRLDDEQVHRLWSVSPGMIQSLLKNAPELVESLALREPIRQRFEALPRSAAETLLASLPAEAERSRYERRQPAIFEQIARLLTLISKQHPLLMLLDDLHWADADSLSLLLHLGHALTDGRILLLGAFRPGELMQGPHEKPHPLHIVYLELQRYGCVSLDLDDVDGRAFVDAFLDREPNALGEQFRSTLYRLTGGNPLLTSELIYSMQENQELVRAASGDWTEAKPLSWDVVPSKVEAVLGRRVARLTGPQHRLLLAASVQGERFVAEVAASVLDASASEVRQELSGPLERRHRLVFAEGLEHVGERRLSGYRFRHALFQQYLYNQLDPVERAHLHESTARMLERLYAQHPDGLAPIAGQLAWHWQQAEFPERAISRHLQAGDWALRFSAYAQAQDHYERGLGLLDLVSASSEVRTLEIELLIRLAEVQGMLHGGASSQVETTLKRAHQLSDGAQLSDRMRFRLADALWVFYHERSQNRDALRYAESYLEFAEQSQTRAIAAQAHSNVATSLLRLGRMQPALEHFVKARELDDEYGAATSGGSASDTAVIVRVSEANVLWYLGYPEQAQRRSDEAISLAEHRGNPYWLAFALIFTCGLHGRFQEWNALIQCAERVWALCEENHFTMWRAVSTLYRAWGLASIGDCQTSVTMAEEALENIRRTELLHTRYPSMMAAVYAACGHTEEALATLHQTEALIECTDEREWEPEIHRLHGELLLRQDSTNVDAAERRYLKAVDVAHDQQSRMLELRALTSLCALRHEQGIHDTTQQLLSERYNWFTEGYDEPDLVAARRLLVRLDPANRIALT